MGQRRNGAGYASGGMSPEFCPSYDALRLCGSLVWARKCASGKRVAQVADHAVFRSLGVLASLGLANLRMSGLAQKRKKPT